MGPIVQCVWIEKTNIGSSQAKPSTKDRPSQVLGASEEAHAAFTQELKKDSPVYESASDEDVFSPIESWN